LQNVDISFSLQTAENIFGGGIDMAGTRNEELFKGGLVSQNYW